MCVQSRNDRDRFPPRSLTLVLVHSCTAQSALIAQLKAKSGSGRQASAKELEEAKQRCEKLEAQLAEVASDGTELDSPLSPCRSQSIT